MAISCSMGHEVTVESSGRAFAGLLGDKGGLWMEPHKTVSDI